MSEQVYSAPGMPALDMQGRTTSPFEFWPTWLMYLPVVVQWLALGVRHRSLTLPLVANPSVPLSGMVGVSKTAVLDLCGPQGRELVLPWFVHRVSREPLDTQLAAIKGQLEQRALAFPLGVNLMPLAALALLALVWSRGGKSGQPVE